MSRSDCEGSPQRFLEHFFSLLNDREEATSHGGGQDEKVGWEDKEGCPLLLADQRAAIENVLPHWVRLLCAQKPKRGPEEPLMAGSTGHGGSSTAASRGGDRSSSYVMGEMADWWFAFPHLELLPTPWLVRRAPLPPVARYRLLRFLQKRYVSERKEEVEREGLHGAFADDLLSALQLHSSNSGDGNTVDREGFMAIIQDLIGDSWDGPHPPPVLLAEILFSEWCAAVTGDASFVSTCVPLEMVKTDLAACCDCCSALEVHPEKGEKPDAVLVGTLSGLACVHPMSTAKRSGTTKKAATERKRRGERNYSSSSSSSSGGGGEDDYDDSEGGSGVEYYDDENDGDIDNYEEGGADVLMGDENKWLRTQMKQCGGDSESDGRSSRRLDAFIARNTSTFSVPLASLVLNIFHVSVGDESTEMIGRHVTPACDETHYRCGNLLWFILGDSKRHRSLLKSKGLKEAMR